MVFEQIIGSHWIEKKPYFAFLFGILFTIMGIISALLVFGGDTGYMIVAFITLLLVPTLSALLKIEMNQELREKRFNLINLFRDHSDILQVYFFLFIGIFFTTFIVCLMLPADSEVLSPDSMFRPQLKMYPGLHATPSFLQGETRLAFANKVDWGQFWLYLRNNLLVLLVCFALSFFYGAGSFLFLSWNATTWGAIFGVQFRGIFHISTFPLILPHLVTETLAYLGAAVAGGILSKALLRENISSKKFELIFIDSLIFLGLSLVVIVFAALIEASLVVQ
jgi:uncharacterized membrane protein SpoIIM required for sporulation